MSKAISSCLIIAGLINFFPVLGVFSTTVLSNAYGIPEPQGNLAILLQHRALLFGILGAIIIASVFKKHLQTTAVLAGLVSTIGFIGIAVMAGSYGDKIQSVIVADVVAVVLLVLVVILKIKTSDV